VGTILLVSNPQRIPSGDFILPPLTDLLDFLFMSYQWRQSFGTVVGVSGAAGSKRREWEVQLGTEV